MSYLVPLALMAAALTVAWLAWRLVSLRRRLPCPASLSWLLDNPFVSGYHAAILSRLELSPGLNVLDAGCGPGLLTIPIAQAVAPTGTVLVVDIQPEMIRRAQSKAASAGLSNVQFLVAGLGDGKLPESAFDRALLVTVLGEIPDRLAALSEIYFSLKPGGFLSISEVIPDPHYQSARAIKSLAAQVGFKIRNKSGNWFTYTLNLEKPDDA
jgi:ubiquinone/menaquinone biosynthesis C-methylase UbiE